MNKAFMHTLYFLLEEDAESAEESLWNAADFSDALFQEVGSQFKRDLGLYEVWFITECSVDENEQDQILKGTDPVSGTFNLKCLYECRGDLRGDPAYDEMIARAAEQRW